MPSTTLPNTTAAAWNPGHWISASFAPQGALWTTEGGGLAVLAHLSSNSCDARDADGVRMRIRMYREWTSLNHFACCCSKTAECACAPGMLHRAPCMPSSQRTVFAVQPAGLDCRDEELGAVRVWACAAGDTTIMSAACSGAAQASKAARFRTVQQATIGISTMCVGAARASKAACFRTVPNSGHCMHADRQRDLGCRCGHSPAPCTSPASLEGALKPTHVPRPYNCQQGGS